MFTRGILWHWIASLLLVTSAVEAASPQMTLSETQDAIKPEVHGEAGTAYCAQVSADLRRWDSLGIAFPGRGVFPYTTNYEFSDYESTFNDQRFYRALASTACQTPSAAAVLVSDNVVALYQGASATFTVQLAKAPVGALTVAITRSFGSTNIVVGSGSYLVFTASNWNVPQAVTIFAGTDATMADSKATLMVTTNQSAVATVKVLALNNSTDEEFVGPFTSWLDAKRDFGAKGDGVADDTAALQSALDVIRFYTNKAVLYLPAGTYQITQTLNVTRNAHLESKDIMILGEDPATTTIRWAGASNGLMVAYGAWYAKLSRLTFDGAAKARTAISHGSLFSTYNEFSDLVFQDLAFGIEAGTPDGQGNAETAVERCRFLRCSKAAISIQNPNSLDWYIWNSEFDNCALGVGNIYGAGNFHVYECLFRGSSQSDISIGNTGYFSMRNNTSIGSRAFFTAAPISSCGLVTLQGNIVVNPLGTPIQFGNYGPLILMDNLLQDYQGLVGNIEPSAAFVSVGNVFTVTNAIPSGFDGPAGIRLDDIVACRKLPALLPLLPGPLPRRTRPVIDITSPTNAAGLQAAINLAAALCGQRPVVHLPPTFCLIDQTVTIPAGCDLQLVGDGARSSLQWSGVGRGPVLRLMGPSRATLRDFSVFGSAGTNQAEGIVVENCDQNAGRVVADQANVYQVNQIGLWAEGLRSASVALKNFNHAENGVGVQVDGGGGSPPFEATAGQVAIFAGGSALNGLSYAVNAGGKLLVRDIWYEATPTNSSPRFMICTNSGSFTLHGANVSPAMANTNIPIVLASNFVGRLTFLATEFTTSNCIVAVKGNATNTSLLLLGTLNSNNPNFNSPQSQTYLLQSFQSPDLNNFSPMSDIGTPSADYLRTMLAQTRNTKPPVVLPLAPGVTDLRIYRVELVGGLNGLHLRR
jgi:hypothetical protein